MVVYADTFIPIAEREKAAASGEDPRRVGFLKRHTVFHVAQCDGLPADDDDVVVAAGPTDVIPLVETIIAATGADIRIGVTWRSILPATTSSSSRRRRPISSLSTGTAPNSTSWAIMPSAGLCRVANANALSSGFQPCSVSA